jgi:hypothetical protein
VGHGDPVESLTDVGGVHGASRDIDPPAGVAFIRQISEHSVEPTIASRSRNLFSHDERGPTGGNEAKEVGPQVPWIVDTGAFAGDRERLTRAGAGPEGPIGGKPGNPGCERPSANPGEEVTLGVAVEVMRLKILDAAFVDHARRQLAQPDHFPQPRRGLRIELVVEVHAPPPSRQTEPSRMR